MRICGDSSVNLNAMKTILNLLVAGALISGFVSCKSFKDLSKQKDGDDVYYSMKDAKKERAAEKKRREEEAKKKEEAAKQQQIQENNAKALATSPGTDYYDQPFDYDDYYDYEYAARLRRFNHPVQGNGYYDNYYTNSYYYNQNPYYYGTSIYNSYNFWGPSAYAYNYCPSTYFYYNSGWAWGTGMYYGNPVGYYDPWANNGWGYNPYYSYYPGWNGGWYGPMTGIYSNYWGGPFLGWSNGNGGYGYGNFGNNNNNNYYFNSYDNNSYYYGPRHTASATDGRPVGSGGPAFGERFVNAVATENNIENAGIRDVNRIVGVPAVSSGANQNTEVRGEAPVSSGGVSSRPESGMPQGNSEGAVGTPPPVQRTETAPPPVNANTPAQPVQRTETVPPPPVQQQQAPPRNNTTPPPPAPDYSKPRNDFQAPSQTQSRSESGNTPSAPAPSNNGGNNGGGNNGGSQPRGNSGTSGSRPR